ncbi:glycosyl hydrolase 108 family protein [Sphingomonas naphthae]|uniref:Glycosyl hydrolase 108 family protein n=1 Tax=Sphingomonas naphthae TaxID=1813468 RepID=A0ABY7TS70_9SPHN|nr:glycosyl hydrolase 108 family protein [Sphingomonas naphthae]WCT75522.1 glycosyl hydrolase 108 family protein [Sphingomonas naphthae]
MLARDFIAGYIRAHEGGLSLHPADNGNWYDPASYRKGWKQQRNVGSLVGSKFGVTAYALNAFRGVVLEAAAMRIAIRDLTIEEAISIGVKLYYTDPGFGRLRWNRVTASIMDKGWGSGPDRAIKMMQKMIGVVQDGDIGPKTVAAYSGFLDRYGEPEAAARWADARIAFDEYLASNEGPNDPDKAFVGGWHNRTRSFLPGTRWWAAWSKAA